MIPMHTARLLHTDPFSRHGRLPLPPPDAPVQPPVLQVRQHGEDQTGAGQADDGGPAGLVERLVLALEELAADDAGGVGAHNKQGHGDAALAGGASVECEPRAVDGVVGHREGEGERQHAVAGVVVVAVDERAVGDRHRPPDEHAQQHQGTPVAEVVGHQAPADVEHERDPATHGDEGVGDEAAVAEGADEGRGVRVERVVGGDGCEGQDQVGVNPPIRELGLSSQYHP